ncbi:MAG: 1-deoxy-D-xylulose-5-phosphate reductoisomerase [Bacteroidales bacterium]|jgi:1-deoxy-D-xylulose-5-phosphate reductoisomerase|nr:1-deoxy-D-xylulose-5-phosphate reductoisomerase [Bacteroidales bacterium]
MEKRNIAILGSTGSIGTQTLDVVRQHPDRFDVFMISAGSNAARLVEQARAFQVKHAVICDAEKYPEVREALAGTPTQVHCGIEAACGLVAEKEVDIVVASMVGFSGLRPTLSAIRSGKTIALANKETLVAAGYVVMSESRRCGAPILPVDSEHSAIFQCLAAAQGNPLERIHLTASGGPFRTWSREQIEVAGKDLALRHPNWNMGAKITIDSATMMNKGFEVIEAKWLFDVEPERIHVVVHPESVIHSMVEFRDGAVIAQLGCPDMREPIALALAYPERLPLNNKKLDFSALERMTFFDPDMDKFPCLQLAFDAIGRGGNIPCALNAANEAAVAGYLEDRIGFYDIAAVAAETLSRTEFVAEPTLEDIFITNDAAYAHARSLIW